MVYYTATPDYYRDYICHDFYAVNDADNDEYLEHYGVPGMKWGVRKQRVLVGRRGRRFNTGTSNRPATTSKRKGLTTEQKKKLKRAAIGVGAAAGVGLAAYGGYKLNKEAIRRAKWRDEVHMLTQLDRAKKNADNPAMKKRYEDLADMYRKRMAAGKYSARHKVRMLLYNE